MLGKPGPSLRVKDAGGTTAGIGVDHNCVPPPALGRRLAYQVAAVEVPRLKFIVSVPFAKLALRPRPHAGARAISKPMIAVNHSAPSGPAVIILSWPNLAGPGNSVIRPAVVMRPILPWKVSVNHSAPSGPAVIPKGSLLTVAEYSVIIPAVVIRPIL